jgi:sterol desaturase/sphingolipid hydroxylase (fatty acid hydroxylase superfamily)
MKKNEPTIAPEVLSQPIPNSGMNRNWKILLAFGLGVLLVVQTSSLFWLACSVLSSELGDVVKWLCILVGAMWVCFLVAQFLLSRGNPWAVRQDWPVIAALNFAPFCSVIVVWVLVTGAAALAMLVAANITLGCSCAGAALAAFIARRRARKIALQAG